MKTQRFWNGVPIEQMSKEELIEAFKELITLYRQTLQAFTGQAHGQFNVVHDRRVC